MDKFKLWLISFSLIHSTLSEQISVATFLQNASIYNSKNTPTISDSDQINLQFKTKQDTSNIFYVGTQPSNSETGLQYLLMYLDNRQLGIRIKHDGLAESIFKVSCVSIYSRCTDNRWHTISVSRKKNTIKVIVDTKVVVDKVLGITFTHLISQSIIFGGKIPMSNSYIDIQETASFLKNLKTFKGCMQQIIYSTDEINLDILAQAKLNKHFQTHGEIYFDKCSDPFTIDPISFITEESYITLAGWAWAQKGKLQFTFKTVEPNALLAYQKSETSQLNQFDFYAFEIRQSFLHFSINTGSGVYQQKVSNSPVSDGINHYVKLWFEDGKVEVQLDADKKIERTNSLYKTLDTTRDLYLGGIPETIVSFLPHSLWSGILRQGFVGCLIEISVNDEQYDLALKAQSENISGIISGCPSSIIDQRLCENRPCMDGYCTVGYNRFICDCSRTNYTGKTCARVAPLVKFNGFQQMIINMPNGFQSECEDVVLRFLTTRPNGIFIVTKSRVSGASDRLEVFLENGKLVILLNFGRGNNIIRSDYNCFDGNWHTLKLKRRQLSVILIIDDMEKKYNINGTSKLLANDIITVGTYDTEKIIRYFTGYMMHFTFNGINYFELAKEESPSNIEVTATIGDAETTKEFPITFPSTSSYIRLPRIDMYGDFKLEFQIKTKNSKGSILQLYGKSGDYLILEIVNGYLNLLFNWGNGFNKKVRKEIKIDDNKWHRVILIRENSKSNSFAFRIDGQPFGEKAHIELKAGGLNFNSFENLFLGSAEKYISKTNQVKDKVTSSQGFEGCISSFYMNQTKFVSKKSVYQNLLAIAKANNGVVEDCHEEFKYQVGCRPNTCHSGGRCIQQWIRIRCDCAMTTFVGERCDKVSKTLKFNDYPAYLIYKLSPTKNTTLDELAFGIQTSIITSSSIILIEGDGKQSDFISAKLMKDKGRALMIVEYNLGSGITRLIESTVNIADGFYHRIAFRRNGNVASLQIDDYNKMVSSPKGKTSIHFNQQRTIYVGKYPYPNQRTSRSINNDKTTDSFTGYLSGLYFNRIPLSDMIDNISYPGIKLLNRSNVYVENKFIPNFQSKQSILSEQGEKENNPIKKNSPIVVAKLNCSTIEPMHNSDCKVSDSVGIIRPIVSYKINTVTHSQKITTTPDNDIFTENTKSEFSTINKSLEINNSGVINIWLIIGFSIGGSLLLVFITCFIYRCFRKDEGSYNVEEDHIFIDPSYKSLNPLNSSKDIELTNNYQNLSSATFNSSKHKSSRNDKSSNTKEWYV